MIPFWVIGGIIAAIAIATLTISVFVDNVKEFLLKHDLLNKVLKLCIKNIKTSNGCKTIKFDALDAYDETVVQDLEYKVDADTEIDKKIYKGASIYI